MIASITLFNFYITFIAFQGKFRAFRKMIRNLLYII